MNAKADVMTPTVSASFDDLLERLRQGDAAAATELFFTYEPVLRSTVRRQLSGQMRAKFDSVDVVQSVWADVLHRFRDAPWEFADAAQLKGFLVRSVQNRFIDHCRHHQKAVAREHPLRAGDQDLAVPARGARPSEEAQAHDLWEQMLNLCPPQHHGLLEMKREGMDLDEIARRTGMHPSSVRRVLYDLARKLAFDSRPLDA